MSLLPVKSVALAQETDSVSGAYVPEHSMLAPGHVSVQGGLWLHDIHDHNVVGLNVEGRVGLADGLEFGLGTGLMPAFGRTLGGGLRLADDAGITDMQIYGGKRLSGGTTLIGAMANLPLDDGSEFLLDVFGRSMHPLGGGIYFLADAGLSLRFGDIKLLGMGLNLGLYAALTSKVGFMGQFGIHYYIPDDSDYDSDLDLPLRVRLLYALIPDTHLYGEVTFTDLNDMGSDSLLWMFGVQKRF